ncbi:glycosyltransferase [Roseomonas sp. BN140053]|uniref:glycosyltransferase n=1 Tax=Roseomonas sp. BN140053 TaxID=3391898 RepID=UPI0039E9121B
MRTPAVSVVLPVRDGARFLEAAVNSILGQSLRELELLVVDDGSRDETPAILRRLAAADARLRVLSGPPLGLVPALNRGLREARAPLVARMDADDVAAPERLARQVAALEAAPEVALLGTGWRVVRADGQPRRDVSPPTGSEAIRAALVRANPIAHPTVILRRAAVLGVGGYRPAFRLAEDFDLWLRLAERHELRNLPEPLLDYREHAGQSAWQALEQRALSEMGALAAAARRRAGGADGADGPGPVDRALLRRLGVTAEAIRDGLLARALGTAKDALRAEQFAAARAAVALGLQQPGLRARTRLHLWVLRLRAAHPWGRVSRGG